MFRHYANRAESGTISSGIDFDDQDNIGKSTAELPPDAVSGSSSEDVEYSYSEAHAPIPHMYDVEEVNGADVASSSHGSTVSHRCSEEKKDFWYTGFRVSGLMDWVHANQQCLEYYQNHGTPIRPMEDFLTNSRPIARRGRSS